MVFSLINAVMGACQLQQKDLAEVMGVSLDRVKSLTSGRVKNLTQAEQAALTSKLGIDPNWLITGEGEMFSASQLEQRRIEAQAAVDALARQGAARHAPGPAAGPLKGLSTANDDGAHLLENWKRCNSDDRKLIDQLAARLANTSGKKK